MRLLQFVDCLSPLVVFTVGPCLQHLGPPRTRGNTCRAAASNSHLWSMGPLWEVWVANDGSVVFYSWQCDSTSAMQHLHVAVQTQIGSRLIPAQSAACAVRHGVSSPCAPSFVTTTMFTVLPVTAGVSQPTRASHVPQHQQCRTARHTGAQPWSLEPFGSKFSCTHVAIPACRHAGSVQQQLTQPPTLLRWARIHWGDRSAASRQS